MYCPLGSKLQTEIALSSTEAWYNTLSSTARDILPVLSLAKVAAGFETITNTEKPVIQYKMFEDNQGDHHQTSSDNNGMLIPKLPKMRGCEPLNTLRMCT
jgi:hypothetical protein